MPTEYKGLILAAGFGTRLRPLTDQYPKPLIPYFGTTPLAIALATLARAGIRDIAVNSHYLPEKIEAFVKQHKVYHPHLNLQFSFEPEILGTGGALNPLRNWLGEANLVIINGDVVSTTDLPKLISKHEEVGASASMALLSEVIPGESSVFYEDGLIRGISKTETLPRCKAGNFACVQVVTPEFIKILPSTGTFDIVSKGYLPALANGLKISASIHKGFWHDLRSPEYYWASLEDLLENQSVLKQLAIPQLLGISPNDELINRPQIFIHPTANIDPSATIGPKSVIEAGAIVGSGAIVTQALVLPNTNVAPNDVIRGMIVGPGIKIQLNR